MLKDSNAKAAKMSVNIMIDLYKKNIWNDSKTVNVIANVGCFSKFTKVMVASLKFFLGTDPDDKDSDESESDGPDLKSAILANRVNKKTKKRQKQLAGIKKLVTKTKKKKTKPADFNFSGIHLVHNPQGMAENLFKQLQNTNERFEVKMMHLDVISRLIGIHELFLFTFYPYVCRYLMMYKIYPRTYLKITYFSFFRFLQPHQRMVTRILQFSAQAAHELVPGHVIEPIITTIANNFITERNSGDVMAIGLNAVRAICSRCPLAMSEDLLRDLALYKAYKEKSVMMAARSLIMLYREQLPDLLHKKDRGRPTEAQLELKPKEYGEVIAHDYVPGAEVLLKSAPTIDNKDDSDSDSESDDGWVNVEHSDDEIDFNETEDNDDDDKDIEDDDDEESDDMSGVDDESEDSDNDESFEECSNQKAKKKTTTSNEDVDEIDSNEIENGKVLDEKEAAREIAMTKIFTDEDFKRIDTQNLKKQVTNARKRPLEADKTDFVKLNDIEMIFKKRKHDKQSRLETVMKGRTDRDKFGYKDGRKNINCSKTNREKSKKKNFQMMRLKARGKVKKSFKEKQQTMRKHLLKQKKMK